MFSNNTFSNTINRFFNVILIPLDEELLKLIHTEVVQLEDAYNVLDVYLWIAGFAFPCRNHPPSGHRTSLQRRHDTNVILTSFYEL